MKDETRVQVKDRNLSMAFAPYESLNMKERQFLFTEYSQGLITFAHQSGFKVVYGEVYRSPEEAERLLKLGTGILYSNHRLCLAIDLNLFKWDWDEEDWKWSTDKDDYLILGEYWENAGKYNGVPTRWGGRWVKQYGPNGDAFHFSFEHQGRS